MFDYNELIDGLQRLEFFNQRAGRELWADKPHDVQERDIESAQNILLSAIGTIEQLIKERDAAVADLKNVKACKFCKNLSPHIDKEPCNSCLLYVIGRNTNNFEWRGVREDNDAVD